MLTSTVVGGEISCESVIMFAWYKIDTSLGTQKSCFMEGPTTIDSTGTTIKSSKDADMGGMSFYANKKVSFLPEKLSVVYPYLVALSAYSCSIKTISKENFKGLRSLKYIELGGNQLERLDTGVFNDLVSLELLHLNNNKLKFLNYETFRNLLQLKNVLLSGNRCIDKNFNDEREVKNMEREVEENCGYCESNENSNTNCAILEKIATNSDKIIKNVEENVNKIEAEIIKEISNIVTMNVSDLLKKIGAVEEEQKKQNNSFEKIVSLTTQNDELKIQLNDAMIQINQKTKENEELRESLLKKDQKIDELALKIEKQKEKIGICESANSCC